MSNSDKKRVHAVEENSPLRWIMEGSKVDSKMNDKISFALELLKNSTTDLIDASYEGDQIFQRRFTDFVSREQDILEVIRSLKRARDCLRQTTLNPSLILHEFGSEEVMYPLLPVMIEYSLNPDWRTFQIIHHYTNFLQKLPLFRASLQQSAVNDYLQNEERLQNHVYDEDILHELRSILSEWLENFQITDLPRHGPGSTADAGSSLLAKEKSLWWDEMLFHLLPNFFPIGKEVNSSFFRVSETIFVPKTAMSLRTISMEPATLQFWQQPIFLAFDELFKRRLHNHISLDDQERSRSLTVLASKTGEYATIDLSMASDSVSLYLVERVFPREVLLPLVATRSTHTCINGAIISLQKFSPMGSSVNFPMESIIFAAVCELVAKQHLYTAEQRGNAYVVYGDDIILTTELVPSLIEVLEKCGFLVNTEKSFSSGLFRESCGVFAYNGRDITTPSIPRDFQSRPAPITDSWLSCMVDLSNRLLIGGFWRARKSVLDVLPTSQMYFTTFKTEFLQDTLINHKRIRSYSLSGIWSFRAQNNQLARRATPSIRRVLNCTYVTAIPRTLLLPGPTPASRTFSGPPDYQRGQMRVLTCKTSFRKRWSEDDDRYRLSLWLRYAEISPGRSKPLTIPVGESPRKRLRMDWITIPGR